MSELFESLEGRSLMSGSPINFATFFGGSDSHSAIDMPMAALPKVTGTWTGTVAIPGVHSKAVKIVFTKQTSSGTLTGVLTSPSDSSIKVTVTGKVKSNGTVSIKLNGGHKGGAINGSGSGKLKSTNKSLTLSIGFIQGTHTYPGTITLKKA